MATDLVWYAAAGIQFCFAFVFFKHGVHMFSLSESTQRGLFDVVFPCHDGMSVCSRAAVV